MHPNLARLGAFLKKYLKKKISDRPTQLFQKSHLRATQQLFFFWPYCTQNSVCPCFTPYSFFINQVKLETFLINTLWVNGKTSSSICYLPSRRLFLEYRRHFDPFNVQKSFKVNIICWVWKRASHCFDIHWRGNSSAWSIMCVVNKYTHGISKCSWCTKLDEVW